ncbi:IclR family transcriptional regulator [Pseudonocardia nigra]|uniref:IclR family transcriptional regulator n=1 Tax=Pseudonocardia nigra TaxID=1921578 RepID=UPI0027E32212|nr:IclR family transcriptional regulator C-terminal domain-containing protein [Pseudonocardia nigra]
MTLEQSAGETADPQPARPTGILQSVGRALLVLETVAEYRDGVSAKEVAQRLGLTLPTTYHLLSTLIDNGYVVHLHRERRYGLGYRVRLLDQALHRQLAVPADVAVVVRALHERADAAAYYAVYRNDEIVLAHVEDSARRPRIQLLDVGFHRAAHATAFGKVMLAAMEPAVRAQYLAETGLPPITPQTITDADVLESQLAHTREVSIAMELEEFHSGIACLASPVRAAGGVVAAAVAISLPAAEFLTRRWDVERAVRQSATTLSRTLQGRPTRG